MLSNNKGFGNPLSSMGPPLLSSSHVQHLKTSCMDSANVLNPFMNDERMQSFQGSMMSSYNIMGDHHHSATAVAHHQPSSHMQSMVNPHHRLKPSPVRPARGDILEAALGGIQPYDIASSRYVNSKMPSPRGRYPPIASSSSSHQFLNCQSMQNNASLKRFDYTDSNYGSDHATQRGRFQDTATSENYDSLKSVEAQSQFPSLSDNLDIVLQDFLDLDNQTQETKTKTTNARKTATAPTTNCLPECETPDKKQLEKNETLVASREDSNDLDEFRQALNDIMMFNCDENEDMSLLTNFNSDPPKSTSNDGIDQTPRIETPYSGEIPEDGTSVAKTTNEVAGKSAIKTEDLCDIMENLESIMEFEKNIEKPQTPLKDESTSDAFRSLGEDGDDL